MTLKDFMTEYMPHKIESKLTKEEQIQKTVHQWFIEIRRELGILPKEKGD